MANSTSRYWRVPALRQAAAAAVAELHRRLQAFSRGRFQVRKSQQQPRRAVRLGERRPRFLRVEVARRVVLRLERSSRRFLRRVAHLRRIRIRRCLYTRSRIKQKEEWGIGKSEVLKSNDS
jgi:hypothetical protein